jgi:hypothetical protein
MLNWRDRQKASNPRPGYRFSSSTGYRTSSILDVVFINEGKVAVEMYDSSASEERKNIRYYSAKEFTRFLDDLPQMIYFDGNIASLGHIFPAIKKENSDSNLV